MISIVHSAIQGAKCFVLIHPENGICLLYNTIKMEFFCFVEVDAPVINEYLSST